VTAPATTRTADRLQAAADRLRAARAEHPRANFVAVDPEVIDALAGWLAAEVRVAVGFGGLADDDDGFDEGLAVADAILWDVPR
jgi:hypothetical protein